MNSNKNSLFLSNRSHRTGLFKINKDLEMLLAELSDYLAPVENKIEDQFTYPSTPPLFLIGNPRSGTTVFMQFLSHSKAFSIPSNFLSRFYYAPYLGAKIQELLFNPKFDFKKELSIVPKASDFTSDLGKTHGTLEPSEFFHFWRRFLPNYDPEWISDQDAEKIDWCGLQKGIAAIESVFGKPFAAKAIIIQYNLNMLMQAFPNSLILYVRRNAIYTMQSILMAREKFYGDRNLWWSVKPKEYQKLKKMDVYHQIAGQVYFTDTTIQRQLSNIDERNKLIVDYEYFCAKPEKMATMIENKYSEKGMRLKLYQNVKVNFKNMNQIRIDKKEIKRLEAAYGYFECKRLSEK